MRSRERRDDPWQTFTRVSEQGPVIRLKIPVIGTSWAAASYETVNEVFKDDESFVREPKNAGRKTYSKLQWLMPRSLNSLTHNMLGADGQRHRRLRSLVDQAFARRNIDGMADQINSLAQLQLDDAAQMMQQDGQVDLLEHFARPFPLTVICELLGLPLDDRPKFRAWFEPFSNVNSVFGILSASGGFRKIIKYLKGQIQDESDTANIFDELIEATKVCSLGQITNALYEVGGQYRRSM